MILLTVNKELQALLCAGKSRGNKTPSSLRPLAQGTKQGDNEVCAQSRFSLISVRACFGFAVIVLGFAVVFLHPQSDKARCDTLWIILGS